MEECEERFASLRACGACAEAFFQTGAITSCHIGVGSRIGLEYPKLPLSCACFLPFAYSFVSCHLELPRVVPSGCSCVGPSFFLPFSWVPSSHNATKHPNAFVQPAHNLKHIMRRSTAPPNVSGQTISNISWVNSDAKQTPSQAGGASAGSEPEPPRATIHLM